jgi:transposase InsO family protein
VSTIYRVLVRHGLVDAVPRKRRREDYRRWERAVPMELWQLDIVDGIRLADGSEIKIVTGVDNHSRFCVIATVVRRATGRAVCQAFTDALHLYGFPDEVLTDNGKQFTGRFTKPRPAEVLFERICRENGIVARDTKPRSPTTTGKVERFHQTLQRELLDHVQAWPDLATAQAAIDDFREEYNTNRPHQSLHMAFPADRFSPRTSAQTPAPRLPATLPPAAPARHPVTAVTVPPQLSANGAERVGLAVEFTRVVPASGNLTVAGQQFWLGPDRAGGTITFWADTTVVHLLVNGVRLKTVPYRLTTAHLRRILDDGGQPAGSPPLRTGKPGTAIEVDRTVNTVGAVGLAGRQHPVGYHFAGRRGHRPPRPGPASTRPGRCPAAQPAQPPHSRPAGPPPRRPARRTPTPAVRRSTAGGATDQLSRCPEGGRATHPRRHGPRRAHRHRRDQRHHLADLPRR